MKVLAFLGPSLAAAFLGYVFTPWTRTLALRVGAVDRPDARKVHREPTPRLGGLAVLAAVVLVLGSSCLGLSPLRSAMLPHALCIGIGLGLLPIVAVSVRDDIRPLPALPKLLAQIAGAGVAVLSGVSLGPSIHIFGLEVPLGIFAAPISVFWIVGVTNAFNIVDGLDGLSAGLAFISSLSLAGVFFLSGQLGMSSGALVLSGALLGFLPYNMYPARVFLGDAGATAIGFCLACFSLRGGSTLSAGFATLIPVFAIGLPVAETLISIVRRVVRRLGGDAGGVMEADRNHIHHRLLALGVSHRKAVHVLYGVGLLFATSAFVSVFVSAKKAGVLLATMLVAVLIGVGRLGYEEFAVLKRGVVLRVYEAPVLKRSLFVVFVDLSMVAAALATAFTLKSGAWIAAPQRPLAITLAAILAPCTVGVFWVIGMYRGAWRLAGIDDFVRATVAVAASSGLALSVSLLAGVDGPLFTLFAIYALAMLVFVNGSRVSYRVLENRQWRGRSEGEAALIYGAGRGGTSALRELLANSGVALRPVGFLDDDPAKAGRVFNGYPVLGTIDDLEGVLVAKRVKTLILSSPKIPAERVATVVRVCEASGVTVVRFAISFEELPASPLELVPHAAAGR